MIGKQKQIQQGTGTLSVKIPRWSIELLNIIAESREHGTNANDLLKKCLQFIIETAKISGPVPTEFMTLLNMLKLDTSWHQSFNFADTNAQMDVAQVILVLQQHEGEGKSGKPRKGFGLAMITKPFLPGENPQMTLCVDDILERVVEVSMKGLYMQLRDIGRSLDSESLRETLTILCERFKGELTESELKGELPQMGNYDEFGRAIEYAQRTRQTKRRTPDGEAMRQQRIVFNDIDRDVADSEAREWEGEHRNPDNSQPPEGIRPFGMEW